jgi:enoyl-CoA hydratase/carnithine racemase
MAILLQDLKDGVATLTLNRPEVMNALSGELTNKVTAGVNEFSLRKDVRAIVIRGAGGKAFSAGTDLKERRIFSAEEKWAQSRTLWHLNNALMASAKPIIAVIDGYCLGGGFELALFCDLRIATSHSQFGWPEMTLGAYPGGGTAVILPRLIGPSATKKMLFATHRNSVAELEAMGLINWSVAKEKLEQKLLEVVEQIKQRSPLAIAALKQVLPRSTELPFDQAAQFDMAHRRPLEGTKDYEEGIAAHFEKRKAIFVGE